MSFGIQVGDLREIIIRPALMHIEAWSEAAEEIVLGTALTENYSNGSLSLDQDGGGPALGLWQMERATMKDIEQNYLRFRPDIKGRVDMMYAIWPIPEIQLSGNLYLGAAMCRLHYLRQPGVLPEAGDYAGQGAYYKKFYNTLLGAGTTERYIEAMERNF